MKTTTVARGFIGAVASLLGVVAVGCSADVMDEATAGNGEIGSVAQAIGIEVDEAGFSNFASAFMGSANKDSDEQLVAGGYSTKAGNVISTIRLIDYTASSSPDGANFQKVLNGVTEKTLITARAELKMAPIPGHSGVFLAVGGQTSTTGNVLLNTAEVINLNNNTVIAVTDTLSSVRSRFGLTKCGDKLLVASGETRVAGNMALSSALEVFTYNSSDPAASTFDPMVNADDGTTVVTMNTPRKFFDAITLASPLSSPAVNRILLPAGEGLSGDLGDTEILDVNANCQFIDNDGNSNVKKATPHAGPSLPDDAVLSKYGSAPKSITFDPPGATPSTNFEAILGAGQGGGFTSVATYLYNDNATPASAEWTAGNNLVTAHVLPTVIDQSDGIGFSGGWTDVVANDVMDPGASHVTTAEYEVIATSNGARSNPADMSDGESSPVSLPVVGHWGAFLDSLPIVSHGYKRVSAGGGSFAESFPVETN